MKIRKNPLTELKSNVSNVLSLPRHGVPEDLRAKAAEEIIRILVLYNFSKNPPTPAMERDSVAAVGVGARAFRQAWNDLHYSTKHKLASANPKSFVAVDEFHDKLEDVLQRADSLLRTLLIREAINHELEVETTERTSREFLGKPRDTAIREALHGICIAWLLYTGAGQEAFAAAERPRGVLAQASRFADSLLQLVDEDVASESNRKLLGEVYSEAATEARKRPTKRRRPNA